MSDMEFLEHITLFLKAMYDEQKTAVRTTYDMTEWFEIHHGVRQVGILPPQFFNIYSEVSVRKVLHGFEGSILIGRYQMTNLRYADDGVLIAGSMKELQALVHRVRTEREKTGPLLNEKKTKVMKIQILVTKEENTHIKINNDLRQL